MIRKIKSRHAVMLTIILLCMGAGYFLSYKQRYQKDYFFCSSTLQIHSGNERLSLFINFNMNHGDGFTSMNGIFYKEGIKKSNVNLEKEFNYKQIDGEFIFTQKQNGVLELNDSDREILKKYLPDFYITKASGAHHVRIKKLRAGVWIFTTTPVPYLVCTEY